MQDYGVMDYAEYVQKQEKPSKSLNKSVSFESFLKSKSFLCENSNKTPEKNIVKTPEKPKEKLSSSINKMKKLIDSGFKHENSNENSCQKSHFLLIF